MLQIDMPMPKHCHECPMCNEYLMCAIPVNGKKWGENGVCEFEQGRPEWCPIKEQESVVHPEPSCEMTYITNCCCDLCGVQLIREDNFCRCCGKHIEWEGR